jgi:hypothetical protein
MESIRVMWSYAGGNGLKGRQILRPRNACLKKIPCLCSLLCLMHPPYGTPQRPHQNYCSEMI